MIKSSFLAPFACVPFAFASCISLLTTTPAHAGVFSEIAVPRDRIIAVAAPYNEGLHQLLVIQQLDNDRACWQESPNNSGPTQVDPLLVDFDFTGICGRSTDSNGYSIRVGGRDLDWRYGLQVVKQDGDLRLVGIPTGNRNKPQLDIGRVGGWDSGFVKIQLNPGWQMTQRTYLGEPLGHIYFTHEQPLQAFQQPDAQNAHNARHNHAKFPSQNQIRQPYGVVSPSRAGVILKTQPVEQ